MKLKLGQPIVGHVVVPRWLSALNLQIPFMSLFLQLVVSLMLLGLHCAK